MAGLVPAIHVFLVSLRKDVDARDKPGHDGLRNMPATVARAPRNDGSGREDLIAEEGAL